MQSLSLNSGGMVKEVLVPPSKSYANRALVLAALIKNPFKLTRLPHASDVTILIDCLEKIGLNILSDKTRSSVEVLNSFPECEGSGTELSVGEGGTTARFLATLLLLGKSPYKLILGSRLKERPWQEFIDLVHKLGGQASLNDNVLTVQGPIKFPDVLKVDASKTTQFATAFQLVSVKTQTKVTPLHMESSQSYWAMTEKLVQDLPKLSSFMVPADWSSASYPLAFAALNHKITFPQLVPDTFQADSKFYDLLKKFDCVELSSEGIVVHPLKDHHSLCFDVSDALDLVPTLGYFLSHIEGEHKLTGIENLVHKESDRLGEVIKLLKIFNREASTDGHSLFIKGKKNRTSMPQTLILPDDHRMVMTGSLFLLHHGGGSVAPAEAVNKSYPEFFNLMNQPK